MTVFKHLVIKIMYKHLAKDTVEPDELTKKKILATIFADKLNYNHNEVLSC